MHHHFFFREIDLFNLNPDLYKEEIAKLQKIL